MMIALTIKNMQITKMTISKLLRENHGATIIETAIVLPVLLFIIMGGIELGIYFIKQRIVARAVDSVIIPLQLNPNDEDREIEKQIRGSGMGEFDFSIGNNQGNYICARAYSSFEEARQKLCMVASSSDNGWRPEARFWMLNPTKPYYIAVVAHARYRGVIGFGKILPDIHEWHVFQVIPSDISSAIGKALTPDLKIPATNGQPNSSSNKNNQATGIPGNNTTIEDSAKKFQELLSTLPALKQ